MASLTHIAEEIRLAGRALGEFGAGLFNPTIRLGVTGLCGAGKTVFITALVHQLLHGGRLPVFEALASGRIVRARLEPQPDDAVPRFDYETHVRALTEERRWPESTSRISELRLAIEYQSARSGRGRTLAHASRNPHSRHARERTGRAAGRRSVHRLPEGLPRRPLRDAAAAARP